VQKLLATLSFVVTALLAVAVARGDEVVRQVQEELRRRHLFFNEIDGRNTPDVAIALRKYQERQGFPASGLADEMTLRSLGIENEPAPPADSGAELLPDVPVLRSDSAPPAATTRANLPPPPVTSARVRPIAKAEAAEFVRRYLSACESPNVHDELGMYADRVDYFDHGVVDRQYVQNELAVYDQRWPRRSYKLTTGLRLNKTGEATAAKFAVAFQVASLASNRKASGKIEQTFGLARRADGNLEIISIREERVRRTHSRHRRDYSDDAVVRSVRSVFHGIFHR
jgi:hypothetical protein